MKILFRKDQGEWQYLNHRKYSDESKLQKILFKDPRIIPIEDIFPDSKNNINLMLREVVLPGSGSIDLLGIDINGDIYVIETKLASNPEAKREVIGQVLEYAAFLEGQNINWLDGITKKQTNRSIEQHFEKLANWNKENFMQNLQDSLAGGKFKLFIVVDEMNPWLHKTISRMNEHGEEIYALEVKYFADEYGAEILVPDIKVTKKSEIVKPKGYWTKEKFFDEADKVLTDEKTKQTLGQLFDFSNSLGQIDFGSGKSIGTFSLSLPWHDSLVKIFFISYRPQFTWFPFREMVEHGIDKELILGFIRKFQSVGFEFNEKSVELAPTFDVSILNDKERFENFKKYCEEFKTQLLQK